MPIMVITDPEYKISDYDLQDLALELMNRKCTFVYNGASIQVPESEILHHAAVWANVSKFLYFRLVSEIMWFHTDPMNHKHAT
jgi:hypothetical protein